MRRFSKKCSIKFNCKYVVDVCAIYCIEFSTYLFHYTNYNIIEMSKTTQKIPQTAYTFKAFNNHHGIELIILAQLHLKIARLFYLFINKISNKLILNTYYLFVFYKPESMKLVMCFCSTFYTRAIIFQF